MTYQMRPSDLIYRLSIVQLDVQILIDALQRPPNLDFILQLNGNFVFDQGLEETAYLSVQGIGKLIQAGEKLGRAVAGTFWRSCRPKGKPLRGFAHLKKSIVAAVYRPVVQKPSIGERSVTRMLLRLRFEVLLAARGVMTANVPAPP